MSVFFDIFEPSRRHVEDERNRLEWTRDEEGEGEPHRGPIDLDSGVVSIKAPGAERVEPPDTPAAGPHAAGPEAAEAQVTRPEPKGAHHSAP